MLEKVRVDGDSADPAMENNMVGELGGPRGYMAGPNHHKNGQ